MIFLNFVIRLQQETLSRLMARLLRMATYCSAELVERSNSDSIPDYVDIILCFDSQDNANAYQEALTPHTDIIVV